MLGDGALDDILGNQQVHTKSGNGGPPNGIDGDIIAEGKRNDAGLPIGGTIWGEVMDDGGEFAEDVHAKSWTAPASQMG